jgi:hypothetical protein
MASIPHVSVSQLNTFSQCQGRWFFRYLPDFLLKTPPNAYLTQGQAVHKAQEVNYLQKIESGGTSLDDVCEACADEFQRRAPIRSGGQGSGAVLDHPSRGKTLSHGCRS